MMKKILIATIICSIILAGCAMVTPILNDVEQPKYTVISSAGPIEVRQYNPMIIAQVNVQGSRSEAVYGGFRMLADYIFGNNTSKQDIAMTAPVQQQASEKIAMTAPVMQQSTQDSWNISFIMPSSYNMTTLPKPNNNQVKIKELPAKRYVAIQFSGINTDNNISQHQEKLLSYIKTQQLKTTGTPTYAFYNRPWTLPFLKRNEILIEVSQ